ncbi:hypothetical protein J8137_07720 [Lactiplantibacillus plantarum]|nr:hypothetical protein [Lactiplantibacillus plantarum]
MTNDSLDLNHFFPNISQEIQNFNSGISYDRIENIAGIWKIAASVFIVFTIIFIVMLFKYRKTKHVFYTLLIPLFISVALTTLSCYEINNYFEQANNKLSYLQKIDQQLNNLRFLEYGGMYNAETATAPLSLVNRITDNDNTKKYENFLKNGIDISKKTPIYNLPAFSNAKNQDVVRGDKQGYITNYKFYATTNKGQQIINLYNEYYHLAKSKNALKNGAVTGLDNIVFLDYLDSPAILKLKSPQYSLRVEIYSKLYVLYPLDKSNMLYSYIKD